MVWFCVKGDCNTVNSNEFLCCKMCGEKRDEKLEEGDVKKSYESNAPKVKKVLCIECNFTFFTIYDERVEKRMCGTCMPEVKSNAIKVREWEE